MKECKKCKKRAITDLNAPNGSRDNPFQSQEFGQDGHCHSVGFQTHFHLTLFWTGSGRTLYWMGGGGQKSPPG